MNILSFCNIEDFRCSTLIEVSPEYRMCSIGIALSSPTNHPTFLNGLSFIDPRSVRGHFTLSTSHTSSRSDFPGKVNIFVHVLASAMRSDFEWLKMNKGNNLIVMFFRSFVVIE